MIRQIVFLLLLVGFTSRVEAQQTRESAARSCGGTPPNVPSDGSYETWAFARSNRRSPESYASAMDGDVAVADANELNGSWRDSTVAWDPRSGIHTLRKTDRSEWPPLSW